MAWLTPPRPSPMVTGDDGEEAPAWWGGDEEAEAVTMAGVRSRQAATTPRRRRGPR